MADRATGRPSTMTAARSRPSSAPRTGEDMAAGEAPIKQAVKWIEEQLRDHPGVDRVKLVDETSRRFDLSPLDEEFLYRHLAERTPKA